MLGFLKKKKQTDAKSSEDGAATAPAKKKKGLKKWIFIMLILGGMGGGGYFAYVKFFATPPEGTRIYTSTPMAHVKLPQEMMAFSFEQFPDLYDALVIYTRSTRPKGLNRSRPGHRNLPTPPRRL